MTTKLNRSLSTMKSVSIKLVEFSSSDAAGTLFDAQLREHDIIATAGGLRDTIHAVISNSHFGFMLLATAEGNPVGVAYVAAHLSLEHEGVIGWLEELYVLPESRDSGVGSCLLGEVISRARQLGWKGVELEVIAGHERAGRFYVRHGFQPLSRSRYCRIFSNDG
jgi:GNAT superfamily N-acetyltransferase